MNYLIIDRMIQDALIEDVPSEDITTNSIVDENSKSTVDLICKQDGIIAGLGVFKRVFEILGDVDVKLYKNDGDRVKNREKIAVLTGSTRNLLVGERVALNYLQSASFPFNHKKMPRLHGLMVRRTHTRTQDVLQLFTRWRGFSHVELDFEKGVPVKLNGKAMKSSDIISKLNEIGGCK